MLSFKLYKVQKVYIPIRAEKNLIYRGGQAEAWEAKPIIKLL